jgi:protein tyrosine phosphatase (PTP) superfamily phosphohydrolase (DUF442 family)
MTYIHIPVDFQKPTDGDFHQFCSVMEQLKEVPVHVHCIANYRVSAFFYRYPVAAHGRHLALDPPSHCWLCSLAGERGMAREKTG